MFALETARLPILRCCRVSIRSMGHPISQWATLISNDVSQRAILMPGRWFSFPKTKETSVGLGTLRFDAPTWPSAWLRRRDSPIPACLSTRRYGQADESSSQSPQGSAGRRLLVYECRSHRSACDPCTRRVVAEECRCLLRSQDSAGLLRASDMVGTIAVPIGSRPEQ